MANKIIRRIFMVVMLIALGLSAILWFKYQNNIFSPSAQNKEEVAPLFIEDDSSTASIDENEALWLEGDGDLDVDADKEDLLEQSDGEWDAQELESTDLSGVFEDDDFISGIQGIQKDEYEGYQEVPLVEVED